MPGPAQTVSALRSLLAVRFPERVRRASPGVPCAVASVDGALGGGIPAGRLTELVSAVPGAGGQTVIAGLLGSTLLARQRVALVDGSDAFAPESVPADLLRHLVWVRCRSAEEALLAADILVRDGNYAALVVDLRGSAERALRRTPASSWYRLQRAAEGGSVAVLVLTPCPVVPAVPWRLVLWKPASLGDLDTPREFLAGGLPVRTDRGHLPDAAEELAG